MISMGAESTKLFLKREHLNDNNIPREWDGLKIVRHVTRTERKEGHLGKSNCGFI